MSQTKLCETLGIERPVLLAPMANVAGGALAKAVSDAGGFGLLGGGYGDRQWISRQMALVGDARVGIGLITWNMQKGAVESALEYSPAAIWLSFGDPDPYIDLIHHAGVLAICQVGTVAEAERAAKAGADVIVIQGDGAGGHGLGGLSLFGLLPAVRSKIGSLPLVAAGGINDSRGLAAACALGADGVCLGTAFYCTNEALDVTEAKQRLVEARGEDTVRSRVYDAIRGPQWPPGYSGRSVATDITDSWANNEDETVASMALLKEQYAAAVKSNDMSVRVIWAGSGLDGVTAIVPASEVVARFERVGRFESTVDS